MITGLVTPKWGSCGGGGYALLFIVPAGFVMGSVSFSHSFASLLVLSGVSCALVHVWLHGGLCCWAGSYLVVYDFLTSCSCACDTLYCIRM